jgi:hypothetical protein
MILSTIFCISLRLEMTYLALVNDLFTRAK